MVAPSTTPARAPVEQLRSGQGDHQDRRLATRLHQVLDQVQQAVRRPVKVFEDDHQGRPERGGLGRRPPGGEKQVSVRRLTFAGPDGRSQELTHALRLLDAKSSQPISSRLADLFGGRVLRDAG